MTSLLDNGFKPEEVKDICDRLAKELGKQSVKQLFAANGPEAKRLIAASRMLHEVTKILGDG